MVKESIRFKEVFYLNIMPMKVISIGCCTIFHKAFIIRSVTQTHFINALLPAHINSSVFTVEVLKLKLQATQLFIIFNTEGPKNCIGFRLSNYVFLILYFLNKQGSKNFKLQVTQFCIPNFVLFSIKRTPKIVQASGYPILYS